MGRIVGIDDNKPHVVSEVICIKCYHRWTAIRPCCVKLKNIFCPKCGPGHVIETGEELDEEDVHFTTDKQKRYLYGHVFRVVGKYMGEPDVHIVKRFLLGKFFPGVEHLRQLTKQQTTEFIEAIIAKFTTEHNLRFGYEGKEKIDTGWK